MLTASAQENTPRFTLPALRFEYHAFEPYIDAQTMQIHHKMHHMAYVNNLNKAIVGSAFENSSLEAIFLGVSKASDAIRNNAGGHYNHTFFWEILSPKSVFDEKSEIGKAIIQNYGSLDSLKNVMTKTGLSRFGSGWVWLYVNSEGKLAICSTANQDNPLMEVNKERGIPVLGIDVWEHAYYLKYQSARKDYLVNIWNVIDWKAVNKKYTDALANPMLKELK